MYTTCKSESSLVGLETIIILEALVFLLFNDFAFMCMLRAICTVSGYIHAQIARDMSLAETCLYLAGFAVRDSRLTAAAAAERDRGLEDDLQDALYVSRNDAARRAHVARDLARMRACNK